MIASATKDNFLRDVINRVKESGFNIRGEKVAHHEFYSCGHDFYTENTAAKRRLCHVCKGDVDAKRTVTKYTKLLPTELSPVTPIEPEPVVEIAPVEQLLAKSVVVKRLRRLTERVATLKDRRASFDLGTAQSLIKTAQRLIDEGQFDEAAQAIERARALLPDAKQAA